MSNTDPTKNCGWTQVQTKGFLLRVRHQPCYSISSDIFGRFDNDNLILVFVINDKFWFIVLDKSIKPIPTPSQMYHKYVLKNSKWVWIYIYCIWETENVNNKEWLKCVVKQWFLDQFVQNWQTALSDSSKALKYRIFKTKFEFEEYFNI